MSKYNYAGWRPSPPDARDHVYQAPAHLVGALPAKTDLSATVTGRLWADVWDQGNLGACGAFTAAAALLFEMLQAGVPAVIPSRLFIYYATRRLMGTLDQDSGVTNRDLLKALKNYGWCDEALWPYRIDRFRDRPPEEAIAQAAARKITEYKAVPQDPAQMKGCLAEGNTIVFGFTVYESFEDAERTGRVAVPGPGERTIGGHDVLLVGHDDAAGVYKFRNSYDDSWGDRGYGYMPYAYAHNPRLASDFWTITASGLPKPPTPTPLPPVPVPVPAIDKVTLEAGPLVAALRAIGYTVTKG